MKIDLSKPPQVFFFIGIISAFSILIVFILNFLLKPFSYSWYFPLVDSLGFVGSYIFIFNLFNNHFWSWPIFKFFKIVEFPDLRGRWEGTISSSYRNKKILAFLEIRQTFSKIDIDVYCQESQSTSIMAEFVEENGKLALHHEYQNRPNELAKKTMNIHYGTARLCYFDDKNILKGSYYNVNRFKRGHIGNLKFHFRDKKLLRRFSDK